MKIISIQYLIDKILGNYKNKNILVVGLSKTGTTGLYYQIKNSLPRKTPGYFEKPVDSSMKKALTSHNTSISKLIMGSIFKFKIYDEIPFLFNKVVLIVRDPRDRLISELLYFGAYKYSDVKNGSKVKNMIELLKSKETEPQKTSVVDIFANLDDEFLKYAIKDWKVQSERTIRFAQDHSCFILKYEDFVNNSLSELEKYLGFKLWGQSKVDKEHTRVVRTKNSGNWRDWFMEEDISYFKPLFSKYMISFDYDTSDWSLNKNPKISSDHCSEYFRKVINEKAKKIGLKY